MALVFELIRQKRRHLHLLEVNGGPQTEFLVGAGCVDVWESCWVGHELYGHVSKAGPRPRGEQLYAMDMPFVETLEQAQHFRLGERTYEGAMSPWRAPIQSPARA